MNERILWQRQATYTPTEIFSQAALSPILPKPTDLLRGTFLMESDGERGVTTEAAKAMTANHIMAITLAVTVTIIITTGDHERLHPAPGACNGPHLFKQTYNPSIPAPCGRLGALLWETKAGCLSRAGRVAKTASPRSMPSLSQHLAIPPASFYKVVADSQQIAKAPRNHGAIRKDLVHLRRKLDRDSRRASNDRQFKPLPHTPPSTGVRIMM